MGVLLILLTALADPGPTPAARHGVKADAKTYPQATPQEALASVLKAIDARRFDYLLAHLSDPAFVERRLATHGGKFDALVAEVRDKLTADAAAVKQLKRFHKEGDWQVGEERATARLKDVPDRAVHFRKVDGRWFLQNRSKPAADDN